MKKLILFALAAISVVAAAQTGRAPAPIQRVHDDFSAAMMRGDNAAAKAVVKANFAPDFVRTDKKMKENLTQFLANLQLPAGMKLKNFKFKLGSYTLKGGKYYGNNTTIVSAMMTDPKKKIHSMNAQSLEKEVWRKVGAKWMLESITVISNKVNMDGKPMPSGA